MTIGEKIFKYRKQAGLSQEELADKMNVTRQSVSLWETDQTVPSLDSLIMLADVFSVSLDELCGTTEREGEKEKPSVSEINEGNDKAEDGEQSVPLNGEPPKCLVETEVKYTEELVSAINKHTTKLSIVLSSVALAASIIAFVLIASFKSNNAILAVPFLAIVFSIAAIIRVVVLRNKYTDEYAKLHPNTVATVRLYEDLLEIETVADNSSSKATVSYADIKKVQCADKFILIYYGRSVVPILKRQPAIDYELIEKLLNSHGNLNPKNKKIESMLLAAFILSLSSVLAATITVGISHQSAPIPEWTHVITEYAWIFYAFLPVPLASIILGLIFQKKKFNCMKTVIGGIVGCTLMLIYGSFVIAFKDWNNHDFEYVYELEKNACIELPDSGHVSWAKGAYKDVKSSAMIRFDDKDAVYAVISSDERFETNSDFIPLNFIRSFYARDIEGYDYYMVFDVTAKTAMNSEGYGSGVEGHRYILLAYNVEKNLIYALDFIK